MTPTSVARQAGGDRQRRGGAGGERQRDAGIVDRGARHQLVAGDVGRDQKGQRPGDQDAEHHAEDARLAGREHQRAVADGGAEGEGDVGPEQRRDDHGADQDGDAVLLQADRGDHRRQEDQQDEIAVGAHAALDQMVELLARGARLLLLLLLLVLRLLARLLFLLRLLLFRLLDAE